MIELVKEYNNILPLKTLSKILKVANTRTYELGKIGFKNPKENLEIRKVNVLPFNRRSSSLTEVHYGSLFNYVITNYMNIYAKNFPPLHFDGLLECNLLMYKEGYHYEKHIDSNGNRTLSAILFLNNDFEGGELYFEDVMTNKIYDYKPKPGTLLIWPSNFLFPHGVREVKKGNRFSVVAWV